MKKQDALIVRYPDGACSALQFVSPTQLLLAYRVVDHGPTLGFVLDVAEGSLVASAASVASIPEDAGCLGYTDEVSTVTAVVGADLRSVELRLSGAPATQRSIGRDVVVADRVRNASQLVRTITRTGKIPYLRLSDDGASLHYSASDKLVCVDVASGVVTATYRCFCRVTAYAEHGALLVAHNKEGLLCFFDKRTHRALAYLRFTPTEWLAFCDDGAWDASREPSRGVEIAWSDAESKAFVPGVGFGTLAKNALPMVGVVGPAGAQRAGLLANALSAALRELPAPSREPARRSPRRR
ncbi:MAG: hypothetical protein Q8Q09_03220 [Deltaproteobacteria bacterium]|nr:hypothetical protein [Deltaproteobacteria bacterium]